MSRACRSTPAFALTDERQFTVAQPGSTMADEMNDQRAGRSAAPPHAQTGDNRATRTQRGRRFMRIGCAPPSGGSLGGPGEGKNKKEKRGKENGGGGKKRGGEQ